MSVSDIEMLDCSMVNNNNHNFCNSFWKYSNICEGNNRIRNCSELYILNNDVDMFLHPLDDLITLPSKIHSWSGIRNILIIDLQMGYITREYCSYFPMEFYLGFMDLSNAANYKAYWGVIKKPVKFKMLSQYDKRRQYISSLTHGLPWKDYNYFWEEERLIATLKNFPYDLIVTRGKQKSIYLTDFVQLNENKIAYFKHNFNNSVFCNLHNFVPHKNDMDKFQRRCAKYHGQVMYELIAQKIISYEEY